MELSGQICCLLIRSIKEDQRDDQRTSPTIVTRHHRIVISLAVAVALSTVEPVQTGGCLRFRDHVVVRDFSFYRLRAVSAAKEELDAAGSQRSHQNADTDVGF